MIEVRSLVKRFGPLGSRNAVNDISFTIPEGKLFTLLGQSGCGKSTTLRMIAGLEDITGGEIFLAGSPVLELLAAAAARGIPSRSNTNAWWGGRGPITIGAHHFSDDAAVVAALRQRNLGRLALSLDRRYLQYPDLLDRVIRVATLCERAQQPYEVVATEPDAATARLAEQKLHAALGHAPRHLRLTPMETVDIGAAAVQDGDSRTLDPAGIADLIHSAPCATSGFHRPYYLHIAPDGGLRARRGGSTRVPPHAALEAIAPRRLSAPPLRHRRVAPLHQFAR